MEQNQVMDELKSLQQPLNIAARESLYNTVLYATDLNRWKTASKEFGPRVWDLIGNSRVLESYLNGIPTSDRQEVLGFLERTVEGLAKEFDVAKVADYQELFSEMKSQYC